MTGPSRRTVDTGAPPTNRTTDSILSSSAAYEGMWTRNPCPSNIRVGPPSRNEPASGTAMEMGLRASSSALRSASTFSAYSDSRSPSALRRSSSEYSRRILSLGFRSGLGRSGPKNPMDPILTPEILMAPSSRVHSTSASLFTISSSGWYTATSGPLPPTIILPPPPGKNMILLSGSPWTLAPSM